METEEKKLTPVTRHIKPFPENYACSHTMFPCAPQPLPEECECLAMSTIDMVPQKVNAQTCENENTPSCANKVRTV